MKYLSVRFETWNLRSEVKLLIQQHPVIRQGVLETGKLIDSNGCFCVNL